MKNKSNKPVDLIEMNNEEMKENFHGLNNPMSACYANACMQVLYYIHMIMFRKKSHVR